MAFPTAITFPFTSVTIDWTINPSVTAVYKQIIGFRNSSMAIRRGALMSYDNNDVCAFTKTAGDSSVLVLVNMRNTTVSYPVPAAAKYIVDGCDSPVGGDGGDPGEPDALSVYGVEELRAIFLNGENFSPLAISPAQFLLRPVCDFQPAG